MIRLGIDLGGTKIEALALSPTGEELARRRIASPPEYDAGLSAIAGLVMQMEQTLGGTARVGIGHPGSISPASGLMRNANSTWLNERPFRTDLEIRLARPIRLANDADCFALSEATDGAGRGFETVFGVIIGTGVGGGLVMGGKLHDGPQRIAGEWGHNPLPWMRETEFPGNACWCGLTGCIETWLSGPGWAACHNREYGTTLTAEAIATSNDDACAASRELYVDRLARALASVINIIDADCVVLGGGVSNMHNLPEQVEAQLGQWLFSDVRRTRILRNKHGDSSGVRGAAWLWDAEE